MMEHAGMRDDRARKLAAEAKKEYLAEVKGPSKAERERARRRKFREAVTRFDGGIAVTTGLVAKCIVCGGDFCREKFTPSTGNPRRVRNDSAYCSAACRQAAYRQRKRQGQPISPQTQKDIRERREIQAVLDKHGISRKKVARMVQLSEIPKSEIDALVSKLSPRDTTSELLRIWRSREA
jgi:hypothetical protein